MTARPRDWYEAGVKAGRQQILDEIAERRARLAAIEARRYPPRPVTEGPTGLPSREAVYASWGLEVPQ